MNLHMEQAAPATLKDYILYSAALQSGAAAMICLSRSNIILQNPFPRPGDPPRRPESHGADLEKQEVVVNENLPSRSLDQVNKCTYYNGDME